MTKQRKDLVIKLSSMNLLDTYTHMYTLNGMAKSTKKNKSGQAEWGELGTHKNFFNPSLPVLKAGLSGPPTALCLPP